MLRSGWRLLRDSGRVLLQGARASTRRVGHALAAMPGSSRSTTCTSGRSSGFPALAAHVLVARATTAGVRRSLQLGRRPLGIEHVTLQVDHAPAGDRLLEIEPRR